MPLGLQPGLHPGISEKDYHSDNLCDSPTLSCSLAKTLIDQSPLHAWCEHPRLGNKRVDEPSSEKDFGSAFHKLALGKGAAIAVCEEESWHKKAAQAFRDEARNRGDIPLLRHRYEDACSQRIELMNQLKRFGLAEKFEAAQPEVVLIYDDGKVRCRAMLDKLFIDEAAGRATIFDIKTTESAKPRAIDRLVFNQHYDMQDSSYCSGVGLSRPELSGRVDFVFLFQEAHFPYCVTPYRLNGEQKTLGISKWTRAWQMWDACTKADTWPAYTTEIVTGKAPEWGLNSEISASPILPKS